MRTERSVCVYECVCVVVLCPAALGELWEPFRLCGKPFLQVANRFLIWEPALFVEAAEWAEFKRAGIGRLGAETDDGQADEQASVGVGLSVSFGAVVGDLSSG